MSRMSLQARRRGARRRRTLHNNDPFVWYKAPEARELTLTRTDRHFMPSLNWYVLYGEPFERCGVFDGDHYISTSSIFLTETNNQVRAFRDDVGREGFEPVNDAYYVLNKSISHTQIVPHVWLLNVRRMRETQNISHVDVPRHPSTTQREA